MHHLNDREIRRIREYLENNWFQLVILPKSLVKEVTKFLDATKGELDEEDYCIKLADNLTLLQNKELLTWGHEQHIRILLIYTQLHLWMELDELDTSGYLDMIFQKFLFCFLYRIHDVGDRKLLINWMSRIRGQYISIAIRLPIPMFDVERSIGSLEVIANAHQTIGDSQAFKNTMREGVRELEIWSETSLFEGKKMMTQRLAMLRYEVEVFTKNELNPANERIFKYLKELKFDLQISNVDLIDEVKLFVEATKSVLDIRQFYELLSDNLKRGFLFKLTAQQHIRAILLYTQIHLWMKFEWEAKMEHFNMIFHHICLCFGSRKYDWEGYKVLTAKMRQVLDYLDIIQQSNPQNPNSRSMARYHYLIADAIKKYADNDSYEKTVIESVDVCRKQGCKDDDLFFTTLSSIKRNLEGKTKSAVSKTKLSSSKTKVVTPKSKVRVTKSNVSSLKTKSVSSKIKAAHPNSKSSSPKVLSFDKIYREHFPVVNPNPVVRNKTSSSKTKVNHASSKVSNSKAAIGECRSKVSTQKVKVSGSKGGSGEYKRKEGGCSNSKVSSYKSFPVGESSREGFLSIKNTSSFDSSTPRKPKNSSHKTKGAQSKKKAGSTDTQADSCWSKEGYPNFLDIISSIGAGKVSEEDKKDEEFSPTTKKVIHSGGVGEPNTQVTKPEVSSCKTSVTSSKRKTRHAKKKTHSSKSTTSSLKNENNDSSTNNAGSFRTKLKFLKAKFRAASKDKAAKSNVDESTTTVREKIVMPDIVNCKDSSNKTAGGDSIRKADKHAKKRVRSTKRKTRAVKNGSSKAFY